jgi:hypothetical protein
VTAVKVAATAEYWRLLGDSEQLVFRWAQSGSLPNVAQEVCLVVVHFSIQALSLTVPLPPLMYIHIQYVTRIGGKSQVLRQVT